MLAGVVSYKLCDRGYRCENCPLDRELRHAKTGLAESAPDEAPDEADGAAAPAGGSLLFFARNHTWARFADEERAVVGFDDFLLRLFGEIDRIVLPAKRATVRRGEPLAIVVQGADNFVVASPLSGTILRLNAEMRQHPNSARANPAAGGWLAELAPSHLFAEMGALLTGRRALAWQENESKKLELIVGTLPAAERERLGPVMHDGRGAAGALLALVGPARYVNIMLSFLQPDER